MLFIASIQHGLESCTTFVSYGLGGAENDDKTISLGLPESSKEKAIYVFSQIICCMYFFFGCKASVLLCISLIIIVETISCMQYIFIYKVVFGRRFTHSTIPPGAHYLPIT